jgi:tyrosinase
LRHHERAELMRRRRNQSALSEGEWDRLIRAMQCLKEEKEGKNWDYFTELHAKYGNHENDHNLPHTAEGGLHIHSPVYWLPWHRRFILEFETRLRQIDSSIELPYWNWTRFREIPERLKKELFGWMQVSRAVFHDPDRLPSVAELRHARGTDDFKSFDLQLKDLHNRVHVWVGGAMADFTRSPKDPLFFLHHCFVDKVWADWQAEHHPSEFPADHRGLRLPPWGGEVEDVLLIQQLDYSYGPE